MQIAGNWLQVSSQDSPSSTDNCTGHNTHRNNPSHVDIARGSVLFFKQVPASSWTDMVSNIIWSPSTRALPLWAMVLWKGKVIVNIAFGRQTGTTSFYRLAAMNNESLEISVLMESFCSRCWGLKIASCQSMYWAPMPQTQRQGLIEDSKPVMAFYI